VVAVYARSTTVRGLPDRLDAGIAMVQDEVLPALEEMDGCLGLSMMVHRESGGSVVTSVWADEQSLRATREQIGPMRDRAAQAFGGRPEVREWEVAVLHRERETPDGAYARVTWTRAEPAMLAQQLDFFRAGVVPEIQRLPGFCSASLLVHRANGDGVLASVYENRQALDESRQAALGLRESAVRRMSARLVDVAEFEVVLERLRVPASV
jgi:quinol monooxygenase YgiN